MRQTKTQKQWNEYWLEAEELEKKPKGKKRAVAICFVAGAAVVVFCCRGAIQSGIESFRKSHEGQLEEYIARYTWNTDDYEESLDSPELMLLFNVFDISREYTSVEEYQLLREELEELQVNESYEKVRKTSIEYLETWERILQSKTNEEAHQLTDRVNELSKQYYDNLEDAFEKNGVKYIRRDDNHIQYWYQND